MENASKALQIAGAVLLAVIILSLVLYGFKQFGKMPEQEDDINSAKQLAEFNQEFLVYQKKLMYGVDVISCLNKVQSYNDKYVLSNTNLDAQQTSSGFFVGTGYGTEKELKINVMVKLKEPLSESIRIWYINEASGKSLEKYSDVADEIQLKDLKLVGLKKNAADYKYTEYEENDKLKDVIENKKENELVNKNSTDKYMSKDVEYWLYDNGGTSRKETELSSLMTFSDQNMKQVIKNPNNNYTDWNELVWYTAMYNFKMRKFECTSIDFNKDTGRVNEIKFVEK